MSHALLLIAIEIHCAAVSNSNTRGSGLIAYQDCLTEKLACAVMSDVYKAGTSDREAALRVSNCLVGSAPKPKPQ